MANSSSMKKGGTAISKDPATQQALAVTRKKDLAPLPSASSTDAIGNRSCDNAVGRTDQHKDVYDLMNKVAHAAMAKATLGISPSALALAYYDWAIHFATSPGKQMKLVEKAVSKFYRLANYTDRCMTDNCTEQCIEPLPQDHRFRGEAWQKWPFNILHQSFLLQQQWWHNAMTDVPGMTPKNERVMAFWPVRCLTLFHLPTRP